MPCGRLVCLTVAALFLGAADAPAQGSTDNPLREITSLSCTFSLQASGSWVDGEPSAAVKQAGVLSLRFIDIDTAESTAEVVGVSSNDIVVQLSGWNLHFLDIRPAGSLSITTVFGQESRDGKLKAVHSRTDYLPVSIPGFAAQPDAFQYYGECEIGQ